MHPVYQQDDDDCFPACIASLLGLPRSEVPKFSPVSQRQQVAEAQRWLATRGWGLVEFDVPRPRSPRSRFRWPGVRQAVPVYCILGLCWKGGQYGHAVVGRISGYRMEVVHDPARTPNIPPKARVESVTLLVPAGLLSP